MKKISILKSASFTLAFFTGLSGYAQTTINAASNSATINGMQFDYSICEMTLVNTAQNQSLIVTQGFLQPNSSEKGPQTLPGNNLNQFTDFVKVYPNPTDNILFVETSDLQSEISNFQLIDVSGKAILSKANAKSMNAQKWMLDLSPFAVGSYFLMVQYLDFNKQSQQTSFKIQKKN